MTHASPAILHTRTQWSYGICQEEEQDVTRTPGHPKAFAPLAISIGARRVCPSPVHYRADSAAGFHARRSNLGNVAFLCWLGIKLNKQGPPPLPVKWGWAEIRREHAEGGQSGAGRISLVFTGGNP